MRSFAATLIVAACIAFGFDSQSAAQSAVSSFDHFATGFPLTGSHRTVECGACHIAGRFKATPRSCIGCHNGGAAAGRSQSHPQTTTQCESCHQTTLWTDIRVIDHTQATAPCAKCHNGSIAKGKSANHIVTTAPCEMCHKSTVSFAIAATMDHTGITTGCASCHNNVTALGKPSNHIPTNLPCETCHTSTVKFSGAVYWHQPTDTNCTSCHNNTVAPGMAAPPHIPTGTIQCSNCHTNTAPRFATYYTMNHAAVAGMRCDTCHNGGFTSQGATGALGTAQFRNHVVTGGQDCIVCHSSAAASFINWSGAVFLHGASDTNCSSCHNGAIATGKTTPPHIPVGAVQCGNCHSSSASSFVSYSMNHAAMSGSRCDSCHNGSYANEGTEGAQGTASFPNHVPTSGRDCVVCHTAATTHFSSWAGATFVHAPSDTNCSNCHNGTKATGLTAPPHIPVRGVQCSACHSNSATSFATYTMNHAAVSASRCDACHNGSYTSEGTKGAQSTSSYPGHVPTNGRDCIACHASAATTFTTFAGGVYAHQPSDTNCSSCHNGVTATGKSTAHIPVGSAQCSDCHSNTAASFTVYTMNHAAVSASRCDSCHNGSYLSYGTKGALGTSSYAGHVSTGGQDCIACHASAATTFATWAGGVYAHQPSDTNCSSCHNGTIATGNSTPPHIPAAGIQCSNCHTSTAASFTTYTMNHAAVSGSRCDSCHNGSYTGEGTKGALGTSAYPGHVFTAGRDCNSCHASAAATFTSWAGGSYLHSPSDITCTNCHNGLVSTGMTTPPHIPTGPLQCSNCHTNTAASFTTYTMNHGAVAAMRCDTCHNGSYTGEGTKGAQGTSSYPGHVATGGRDCIACHTGAASGGYSTWAGAVYAHQPSDTNCSNCHNGTTATGKTTPPHIPTTAQCSNCHTNTATSFTAYTMNHAAVSASRCDSCHNGSYTSEGTKGAQGTSSFPGHIATGGRDCIACHTGTGFVSWAGGLYVHQATDTNCISCHNGTTATGMTTPPHIPTASIQCSNCHNNSAASFATYTMNHAAVSGSRCDSCHNGSYTGEGSKGAQGTASYAGHVPTGGQDCIACHAKAANGYTTWSGAVYVHQAADTNCANCHNGTTATGNTTPPHIPTTAQCSNCHTNTATTFTVYTMNHAAVSASRCDSCHNGSYTGEGTTGAYGTASYPGHLSTNGQDCIACHAKAATSFTSWAGATYIHQPADTNCSNCHNGSTATGLTTPPHIPIGAVQCSNCHSNTAASFTSYTMNHAAVAASRCDSCHNGSYTTEGTKGAQGTASFANHVATGGQDCVACHSSAATTFTTWAGGTYVHQPSDTNCSTCHNGKTALGMATPPHIPIGTVQCSNCHTSSAASFTTYTMNHAAVSASRCDSCHNGSYASQGTKGAQGTASFLGHVATNGWDCATCHANAATTFTTWAGASYVHSPADTNCSACHNGTIALGMKTPPHIPVGTAQCSNCHTNTASSFTTYAMSHAAVSAMRCDACHNGSYTGEGSKGAQGTASFAGHVATSGRDCVVCHASAAANFTSWAGASYIHQTTDTNCSNCHNGTTATGKTTPPHIPTNAQCSNCHTSTAASFTTYTMNHATVAGSRCDSCHNGAYAGEGTKGAQGTASYAGHVPTGGRDCATCHTGAASGGYVTWAGAVYVHQPTDTNCSSCHNGTTATGKTTPPHIPTAAQCSNCHTNTAASFTSYTMNHAAVSGSRCDSCHNGSYTGEGTKGAQGTASYAGHVATGGNDCITCHASAASSYTSWAGGVYAHQPSDTNCSNCHNGTTATGKTTPPHIPTTAQCSNCHTNTAASFATYTMNHGAVAGSRCDSCHNGSYTGEGTKGAQGTASFPGHVATGGRDCNTCHASAAATFVSWAGGSYVHQATDTNCTTCHNGTTARGMTTPPHIPTGVTQCSNCHSNSAASFVTYTMNHAAVSGMRCDACHNGSYIGEGTKGAQGTASFPGHVATGGRDCITCHAGAATSFTSWSGGSYAHLATDTNCSNCHNGTTATGKTTPPHIPSGTVQCSNCHSSAATSFTTYTMNHAAVSAIRCDACHNGSYTGEGTKGAQGTASFPGHVATGGRDCITCHANAATSFASWSGGSYSHLATDTNCSNCHNGTTATGKTTPPHIPTTAQCSNCHSSSAVSFAVYTMNHAAVSGSRCDSCHNGSYTSQGTKGALSTASYPGHVPTSGRDCIECHAGAASSYTSWAGGAYSHQPTDTNCVSCHNGTTATGMTTPPHIPTGTLQCSNCHVNTAASFTTYTMNHGAVTGVRCDACHNGAYTSQGTMGAYGTASYAGHVPTSGQDCITCHAKAASGGYRSWAGGTYKHQSGDTNCVACHNGTTATGMTTPPHIPTGTIQCSNCHSQTAASFTTYTMNHSAVTSIRCDACHNGSFRNEGRQGAEAKPRDHPQTTADCGCCHSTSSWSNPKRSAGTCTTTARAPVPATTTVAAAVKSALKKVANSITSVFSHKDKSHDAKKEVGRDKAQRDARSLAGSAKQLKEGNKEAKKSSKAHEKQAKTAALDNAKAPAAPKGRQAKESERKATRPGAQSKARSADKGQAASSVFSKTAPGATSFSRSATTAPVAPATQFKKDTPADEPATKSKKEGPADQREKKPAKDVSADAPVTKFNKDAPAAMPKVRSLGGAMPDARPAQPSAAPQAATPHIAPTVPVISGAPLPKHRGRLRADDIIADARNRPTGISRPLGMGGSAGTTRFDHATTSAPCASCHNGRNADGKPPTHIRTRAPCDNCHKSTVTFAGARLNHRSVNGTCLSCHNGRTAMGKPPRHVVTNAPCDDCHRSTIAFAVARFSHSSVTASCASCHNGVTAQGRGPRHLVTTQPCDECHRATSWTVTAFRHTSAFYPNHRSSIECASCHVAGTQAVLWKAPAYKPDCAACHADQFKPQQHVKSLSPAPVFYTVAELRDCTGSCHTYKDNTLDKIAKHRRRAHTLKGGGW